MTRAVLRPIAAIAISVLMWPACRALAQGISTGAITGTVTDAAGAPIQGAQVVVTHRLTGYQTVTLSRSDGLYLAQGLEAGGPYAVRVVMIGHRGEEVGGVTVGLSQSTRVNIQLADQVVELAAIEVNVDRAWKFSPSAHGVVTQVSDSLIRRVPTFSRDFMDLLRLSPQVVVPPVGAASGGGAYNRYNAITVDGANQSERFNLGSTGGVPGGGAGGKIVAIDAVKEFSVMFTPTDVRQGNFAGMLINAATRSGTNDFRGGGSFTYRSSADVAGLDLVGKDLRGSDFNVKQYSFHMGGPIIRNRLHFFVAPEFQERARPALGPYVKGSQPEGFGQTPPIPLDSLNAIASIMRNRGLDVGSSDLVSNGNPLTNLFARLDFQFSQTHRMVVRQIMNRATDDVFFRTLGNFQTSPLSQNQGFRLSSNGYTFETINNSTVAQLYSNFSGGKANELIVGYNRIDAQRKVPVHSPEIGVGVNIGGTVRAVTFGTEQFSPGNLLTQDIYEVVNNVTLPLGRHLVTLGGRFDHTSIFNNFGQGTYGVYTFPTIAALGAGTPTGYAVGYANSRNDADIPAAFRVQLYSLYAQDQWAVTNRLTLTAGLRADIPNLLDRPSQNDTITNLLEAAGKPGVRTDAVPKTHVLWSPRVGFNYDPTGDGRNQIRGSLGVFTGPPPYILLGNAYANTGLGLVRLECRDGQTPIFTVDVDNLPTSCAGSAPPAAGSAGTVGINVTDADFKYPQYFAVSAGFDRQLPFNTVLTVEGLYRKAINGLLIRDANFKGPRLVAGRPYRDRDGRVLYADTIPASGAVAPINVVKQRYITDVRSVPFNEGIIEVTNQSRDFNYSISSQLARRFSDRLEATVAYAYMKSEDVQSLTSDRAISNWRNGRQLSTSHEDLRTTTSAFSRPHRIVAYGTYKLPWQSTDLTLYYERSSGAPFTLVAQGDLNGDLWNSNDPIYIPRDASDPAEIRIGTGIGAAFVQNTTAAQAFERFIRSLDCLNQQRGRIMERNSCRAPVQQRVDLSVRQAIPQLRGQRLSLQLDIFNSSIC